MDFPFPIAVASFGSGYHWIILLVVAFLVFGRRLPSLLRGAGESLGQFRKGLSEDSKLSAKSDVSHDVPQRTSQPATSSAER